MPPERAVNATTAPIVMTASTTPYSAIVCPSSFFQFSRANAIHSEMFICITPPLMTQHCDTAGEAFGYGRSPVTLLMLLVFPPEGGVNATTAPIVMTARTTPYSAIV